MAAKFQAPLLPTPKVVSQGSVSKPKAQPKPSLQAPLLPAPRRTPAPTNRPLNY